MKKLNKEELFLNFETLENFVEVEENVMFTVEGACSSRPYNPTPCPAPSEKLRR